jgi:hypothetical protein
MRTFAWKPTRAWYVDIGVGMPFSSTDEAVSWSEGSRTDGAVDAVALRADGKQIHVSSSAGIEHSGDAAGI